MAELVAFLGPKIGLGAKAINTISTVTTLAQPALAVGGARAAAGEARAQGAEYDRQAREERVAASIRAERLRRETRLRQSRDRTAMAEGGVLSGTSFGVLDQNAVARELEALTVEYEGEQAGRSAEFAGSQARRRASPLNVFSAAIESFNDVDPLNIGGIV